MAKAPSDKHVPTVLVVDDDKHIRVLAARSLEPLGVRVLEADSAAAGAAELERATPDLIVLDLMMPGVNGLEFCQQIRARAKTAETPVLMMTGLDDPECLQAAYDSGATDFVVKPVRLVILQHRVRYLLRSGNAFRQLRDSRERLSEAQRIARLGNWELVPSDQSLVWSEELFRIFGLAPAERIAIADVLDRVHQEDRPAVSRFFEVSATGNRPEPIQYRAVGKDGTTTYLYQQAEVQEDPVDASVRVVGTIQDVTRRKENEAKIRFLAYRDVLTGLPNRRLFTERLERAIALAQRRERRAAVLHIDIDRFKSINEGYGHVVGDELLREVAERLERCLRATDTIARGDAPERPTLSRLGGDEFIVVLGDLEGDFDPAVVAARIMATLGRPYAVGDTEILVSSSIGIAVHPEDGVDGETLIRRAETALAHVKSEGGNAFLFYNARMNTDAAARLELASRLHRALEQGQFSLAFQPIFDSVSRRVRSVETLLRWTDPGRGPVGPGEFIPVAEETGLILPLGDWVIEQACAQWRRWVDAGVGPVAMSVNVSARQFQDADLCRRTKETIRRYGVDASYLCFELTEGTLMSSSPGTVELMGQLRELGICLAIDDFGTGFSSLGYLRRFPAEVLKIDRSFVQGIPVDQESCSLVAAIVAMAHKLRMGVIAEGVETEAQLRFLTALDCEEVQGFLLGRPASATDVQALLLSSLDRESTPRVLPFRKRTAS